jgi:hypothetical protein|tara:strand:+ start:297 stop:590 length:294 start_codon:yes stop_codon:yes gene_type:complete
MSEPVIQALDRLFDLAASDTGQARRAANFLLAWWNAQDNGGFDLADLFGVDHAVAADMAVVFIYLGGHHGAIYPDQLGYEDKIIALVHQWRLHEAVD